MLHSGVVGEVYSQWREKEVIRNAAVHVTWPGIPVRSLILPAANLLNKTQHCIVKPTDRFDKCGVFSVDGDDQDDGQDSDNCRAIHSTSVVSAMSCATFLN